MRKGVSNNVATVKEAVRLKQFRSTVLSRVRVGHTVPHTEAGVAVLHGMAAADFDVLVGPLPPAVAERARAARRAGGLRCRQLALGLVPAPQQQQPQQQEEGAECPICFIDTDADDLVRLACGHAFCLSCMESWSGVNGEW